MKRFRRPANLILVAILALPVIALANGDELVTDRPDQTESAETIAAGAFQVELGYSRIEVDQPGVRLEIDSVPQTLVRIGLDPRWELRIGYAGYQKLSPETPSGPRVRGNGDASLGFKWKLAEEAGPRPQVALLGEIQIASGDPDLGRNETDPAFRFSFSHTLSDRAGVGYNVGVRLDTVEDPSGDDDQLASAIWTVAYGRSLTERWGFFVEAFGESGLSAADGAANGIDAGVTWLLRPLIQLDFSTGVEVTSGNDRFFGVGLSFRNR
ncbi:MAG: transporter [Acidobacteriota bacterium]|nr:transporter [Acidobacteriota bacterium]MDH3784918.1 transporter [Acidobacteriota bacterium]